MVTKKQKLLKISAIFGLIFAFVMVLFSMAVISFDIAKADDESLSKSDANGFVAKELKDDLRSVQQTNEAVSATFNTQGKTLVASRGSGDIIATGTKISDGDKITLPDFGADFYCAQIDWDNTYQEYRLTIFVYDITTGEPSDKYVCLNSDDSSEHINRVFLDNEILDKVYLCPLYEESVFDISSSTEIPPQDVNITFDANGGKFSDGTSSMVIPEPYLGITTIPATSDVFYKDHLFEGWFDVYGNKFEANKVLVSMSGLTVYARWKEGCTITYHANGGVGDDIVTTVEKGSTITLNDGGAFTKEGQVLTGWDTSPDGTGTRYNVVEDVVVNEGMDLYAYWADVATCSFTIRIIGEAEYVLVWDGTPSGLAYVYKDGDEYEFSSVGNNYLVQMEHNLVWSNEISLCLYSARGNKTSFHHIISENLETEETFISKIVVNGKVVSWDDPLVFLNKNGEDNVIEIYDNGKNPVPGPDTPIPAKFNANGGSWDSANAAEEVTVNENYLRHYKFPEVEPVKDGFHLKSWLDGDVEINKDSVFEYMDAGHVFSALWAGYVTFDANGGEGQIDPFEFNEGVDVTMYDGAAFKWDKHVMKGWNTASDGTGTHYDFTDTFPMSGNTTLYAEWEEIVDPPIPPFPPTPVEEVNAAPQTGDSAPLVPFVLLAVLASGVLLYTRKASQK